MWLGILDSSIQQVSCYGEQRSTVCIASTAASLTISSNLIFVPRYGVHAVSSENPGNHNMARSSPAISNILVSTRSMLKSFDQWVCFSPATLMPAHWP